MDPGCGSLQVKMGINKWQDIEVEDLERVRELETDDRSDWWSVNLNFDQVQIPLCELVHFIARGLPISTLQEQLCTA